MRCKLLVIFTLVALATVSMAGPFRGSAGSWGSGCGPVGPTVSIATYHWVSGEDRNQIHLFRGRSQIGTYRYDEGVYYPFDGSGWLEGQSLPVGVPAAPGVVGKPACRCKACKGVCKCGKGVCCGDPDCKCCARDAAFGMEWKPTGEGERYYLRDREIPKNESLDVIQNGVPDDRNKMSITVIGLDLAVRKKVQDDFLAMLDVKDKFLFQSYAPNDFALKPGFVVTGSPTVYIQAPKGLKYWVQDDKANWIQVVTEAGDVLHRQDGYDPEKLAKAARTAVRRVDPNYRPELDPDLSAPPKKPEPPKPDNPLPDLDFIGKKWGNWLFVFGVWLLTWFFTKRIPEVG